MWAVGLNAVNPVFWTFAPTFSTGASMAVGIAYINSFDVTGSFTYALLALAAVVVVGGFIVLSVAHASSLEPATT